MSSLNKVLVDRYTSGSEKRSKRSHDVEFTVPSLRFQHLGGISEIAKILDESIGRPFKHSDFYRRQGIQPAHGILLCGPPGTGKTKLAEAIAGEMQIHFHKVSSPEIISGMSGESENKIRRIFEGAKEHAPCIVLLDEIDAICPKREYSQRDMEKRIVSQLGVCLDDLNKNFLAGENLVMLVATTTFPDSIDASLRRAGRFDKELNIGIPDERARSEILGVLLENTNLSNDVHIPTISRNCPGFVGSDLAALVREASTTALNRSFDSGLFSETGYTLMPCLDDFMQAIKRVQPSTKREGFAVVPNVTWDDIGALKSIRGELLMSLVEPIRNRELFARFKIVHPCSVLLWGPPGCGKTMLAKAVANETHSNFISVKGPELFNKYLGESEKSIRTVFARARSSAPCIIFFDEIDALCPRRDDNNENASSRIVNQLLTEMDGLESRRDVYIVAATNRPDILDPAITRPGRFDKLLYVGLPDQRERAEILRTICRDVPLHPSVDLELVARDSRCQNFSGADLAALVRESSMIAISDILSLMASVPEHQMFLEASHFDRALEKITSIGFE